MPSTRLLLSTLTVPELRQLVEHFEVDGFDRRVKNQIVEALTRSRKVPMQEGLLVLTRDRLKEHCREFDLEDVGRHKADLAQRLSSCRQKLTNTTNQDD